jgi:hypothetical protein
MLSRPEQSNTKPATVTARKLLEANSSRMVHTSTNRASCLNRTTVTLHSQRDFNRIPKIGFSLMIFGNSANVRWTVRSSTPYFIRFNKNKGL